MGSFARASRASAAASACASSMFRAPSATATMLKSVPLRTRSRIAAAIAVTEYGISGIRITSAPPASPAPSVSQPARWPIISATMIRWWLWAVLWSRSMASVAISSAVANPKVASVPATSLSIVLGSVMTLSPALRQAERVLRRAAAAEADEGLETLRRADLEDRAASCPRPRR